MSHDEYVSSVRKLLALLNAHLNNEDTWRIDLGDMVCAHEDLISKLADYTPPPTVRQFFDTADLAPNVKTWLSERAQRENLTLEELLTDALEHYHDDNVVDDSERSRGEPYEP